MAANFKLKACQLLGVEPDRPLAEILKELETAGKLDQRTINALIRLIAETLE